MAWSNDNMACGGYDYQFVVAPLDMLLCKICHLPSKEPQLSVCCGHTFCKVCLDGTRKTKETTQFRVNRRSRHFVRTTCPMCRSEEFNTVANKQNERAIKNLHVFCTNKAKGCDWQGEINNINGHLGSSYGCPYEEVKYPNHCEILLQRQNLSSHVDSECPCRKTHCQYCNMIGKYQYIKGKHVDQCGKVPLPCPNNCGDDAILRENLKVHRATCPLEEIKCHNECGKFLQRQYIANHLKSECLRRKVNCQYCLLSGEHNLIVGKHKEECSKFPIHCPNECEAGSIPREDMEDHRQECPLEVIKCEYYSMGCNVTMTCKNLCTHSKEKMGEHLQLTKVYYEKKTNEMGATINKLESSLQQNLTLMNLLFGEWTIQLNTRAIQLKSSDQILPVIVRMSEYTKNKKDNVDWYSDPFYTHEEGYKMQLNVVPNGYDSAKGTYLSVYLYLMKGPYDNTLHWPLEETFKVTLLNQENDSNHHPVIHSVDSGEQIDPDHFDSESVWHKSHFIKTSTLQYSQYVKKDSLFFEVSKI